jgi:mannose-6-phosphate isomerase-like protein (cupin superfamily)
MASDVSFGVEHVADSVELSGEPLFEARPWGSWRVLDQGVGYKVKRIRVTPGCRLSYQSHLYRSEHWVVISGAATCVIDGVESYAEVGTAVDVPCGAKHRLANGGSEELVVIEVQRGLYTGEDDIVRYEDDYGRES